jgi:hypothetical protein
MREHSIKVTLNDSELARLDELHPPGTSRPAFLRSLLREPPRDDEVATREEALSILTSLARDGRVAAAIALERALRAFPKSNQDWDDELSSIIVED